MFVPMFVTGHNEETLTHAFVLLRGKDSTGHRRRANLRLRHSRRSEEQDSPNAWKQAFNRK